MLQAFVRAVRRGLCADSSYKKEGWEIALEAVQAVTTLYIVTIKQIKNKHNTYKKDQKVQKELYSQSGWGWDNKKDIPVAAEDVINIYFKANPNAAKFQNAPLPHL